VERVLLERNVPPCRFGLDDVFRGGVLSRKEEDEYPSNKEEHQDVEPPGSVEILNIFGLEQIILNAKKRSIVNETHNCFSAIHNDRRFNRWIRSMLFWCGLCDSHDAPSETCDRRGNFEEPVNVEYRKLTHIQRTERPSSPGTD
jgi:hypothetical protein